MIILIMYSAQLLEGVHKLYTEGTKCKSLFRSW